MADNNTTPGPQKVFLWTYGRTVSTTFLKCMTYVPGTVAWFEPYLQIRKFSNHVHGPSLSTQDVNEIFGKSELSKIEHGYDASDKDFDWLKDQLERDIPEKSLVFVKDMGNPIVNESLYDKLPNGFRHTFLIRDPERVMTSYMKLFMKNRKAGTFKNQGTRGAKFNPVQNLNKLWKYVQEQGLEPHPVIIDIDELLKNPKEMLEAYCNEVGIPFTEDLLTWPTGDDVMTKMWMVPKQTILTFRAAGIHDETFASTGFHKRAGRRKEDEEQVPVIVKILAWAKLKWKAYREAPYYREMYAARLTPGSDVNSYSRMKSKRDSDMSVFTPLVIFSVVLLSIYYILA